MCGSFVARAPGVSVSGSGLPPCANNNTPLNAGGAYVVVVHIKEVIEFVCVCVVASGFHSVQCLSSLSFGVLIIIIIIANQLPHSRQQ